MHYAYFVYVPVIGYHTIPSSIFRSVGSDESNEGLESLEGVAAGLYAEVFNAVVAIINRYVTYRT